MVRYVLSLMMFFAGFVLTVFLSGGYVRNYLDMPSLLITGIIPFVFVSILFGFKGMLSAFSAAFGKDTEKGALPKALDFFKVYGKTTWIAGIIAALVGLLAILINLEDKTALGPNLALALISLLYSGIINLVLILPFTVFVKKRLNE